MLRAPLRHRALAAVAPPDQVAILTEPIDFIDAVTRGSADVALLDPMLVRRNGAISILLSRAHMGTVLYIQPTPEYAQAAVAMIREVGAGELVTSGYNDDPTTFAGILRRQSRAYRGQLLLRRLALQVASLPSEVRAGILRMSEYGGRIDSVERLATICGVSRPTLWRQLRSVGIVSALGFVTGLTLLRNYDALVDPDLDLLSTARIIGLSSGRALQRRCTAATGLTLSAIRTPISIETLADYIARVLTEIVPATADSDPALCEQHEQHELQTNVTREV